MPISIKELYSIFQNNPLISTDSRKIEKGSIFFALKGGNFDGNEYAAQAIANGSAYAVVDAQEKVDGEQFILVDDVLKTLQDLAAHHRDQLKFPVLCITGTNGKTTTKELVSAVLDEKYRVSSTEGNFNNHIGVPLTVLKISQEAEIAIIELGANHVGEIDFLCGIAKPTHGLITNIGKAHLEGFGNLEGVKKAKTELYDYLKVEDGQAFVNHDNALLVELSKDMKKVFYGSSDKSYCMGSLISGENYLQISYTLTNEEGGEQIEISSQLIGAYNFENVLAAICIGSFFQVPAEQIAAAIKRYIPDNSRSQEIETANNHIIMDAYNANPTNMQAALDSFTQQVKSNRMVILGDMLELGSYAEQEHRAVVEYLIAQSYDRVILVGEQFSKVSSMLRCENFASVDEAKTWLQSSPASGMNILIKGSRSVGLEALLDSL